MKISISFVCAFVLWLLIITTYLFSFLFPEHDFTKNFIAMSLFFLLFAYTKLGEIVANQKKIIELLQAKQ